MIKYLAVRDWPHPGIPIESPFEVLDEISLVPLHEDELLLAAHYFPIVIALDGPEPVVGALVGSSFRMRPLVGNNGKWLGAYSPIVLRCFPFRQRTTQSTGDPIADLEFARILPARTERPRLVRVRDDDGAPSKELQILYDGVRNVAQGQQRLRQTLDVILAADLLIPIGTPAGASASTTYYSLDRRRFGGYSKAAVAAIGRHSFAALDLATALGYSQIHLRPELRAITGAAADGHGPSSATGDAMVVGGLETLTPWLDTSELFPGAWAADPSLWTGSSATNVARAPALTAPASTPRAD